MNERDNPLSEPCPECGKTTIKKGICASSITSDNTLTADKATGGRWGELMKKMKESPVLPKKYHSNLDAASSRSGRRWRG